MGDDVVPSTLGTTLENLTDVTTTGKVAGNILYWTGSTWTHTSTSTLLADSDLGNLTATGDTLIITGGNGASIGNVTITVDSDVEALADLSSTVYSSARVRELTTRDLISSSQAFTITNANGVAGNPTISLGTLYLSDLTGVSTTSLQTNDLLTYNGTSWVRIATSSLGLGNNTFLAKSDTINSYNAGSLLFETGAGVTHDANLVFKNGNLGIGTTSPYARLSVGGTVVANYFIATSSTSTLRGLTVNTLNCTSYINGGKVTTDSNGNLICHG